MSTRSRSIPYQVFLITCGSDRTLVLDLGVGCILALRHNKVLSYFPLFIENLSCTLFPLKKRRSNCDLSCGIGYLV